jgi:hypothetical protein
MTRLWTDGAEFGDGLFFELTQPNVYTSPVRSGVYCYGVAGYAGPTAVKLLPTHMNEFYMRWCSYINYVGADIVPIWAAKHDTTNVVGLNLNTSGKLYFTVGGTQVAEGTYPFVDSYWHLLDIYVKIHATSGSLLCKLDGILDIQYGGDTRGGSQTQVDRVQYDGGWHLGFYPVTYFDDIALNDTSDSADNSWCGDGHVELLRANAEGDTLQWTPTSGSHFQCVDDYPPNGDTDYIGTILPNVRDMIHLAAFDDTNKIVRRVYSEMRARDMSAVGQVLKLGVKTSGSVYLCTDSRVLTYNYTAVKGDEMLVNPATGSPWDKTALDALQFVVNSENIIG